MFAEGQTRKRLIKVARRIPRDEIVAFLNDGGGDCFVLNQHGIDVLLAWYQDLGFREISIDDEVLDFACIDYLKSQGKLYETEEEFLAEKQLQQDS